MKYFVDGFLLGPKNPSRIGGGYTVFDENNKLIRKQEFKKHFFTNNDGELFGILEGLRLCEKGDSVSTDSMCCLSWARGGRSKARPDLNPLCAECLDLIIKKRINLMWEARQFNLAGIFNEKVKQMNREQEPLSEDDKVEIPDNF